MVFLKILFTAGCKITDPDWIKKWPVLKIFQMEAREFKDSVMQLFITFYLMLVVMALV